MSKKLAICVPHYKREEHLKKFIPHMDEFFKDKDIEYKIFVANQVYPDSVSGFNRGTSKNVAFDVAQKEGYDYFCFHDIDMLPEDDTCDYSYPEKVEHLAVHVEQFDYGLKYQEYFGGSILFTKEHYEKINGYSNGYFNWGMEDDDLFYRTKKKGLAEETFMNHESDEPRSFLRFNGLSDYVKISPIDSIREITGGNFTMALLVRAEDRFDIPKYLIGDVENATLVTSALSMADFYEEVTTKFSRNLEAVTARQALNDLTELTIVQIDSDLVLAATETQTVLNIEMREAITIEAAVTSGCDFIVTEVLDQRHTLKGIHIRSLEEMMNDKENQND